MRFLQLNLILVSLLFGSAVSSASETDAQAREALEAKAAKERYAKVQPLLALHCFGCHGPEKQRALIRFDRVENYRIEEQRLWVMAHDQILTGAMPPEDSLQLKDADKKAILSWIEQEAAAARKMAGAGHTRRLNRREFSAALQDLTGLSVDFAHALPGDGKVAGFDTGASGLQDAADSVAQVMKVTRVAVDALRFLEPAPGKPLLANTRESADPRKTFDAWKTQGVTVRAKQALPKKGSVLEPKWLGDRDGMTFNIPGPVDGSAVLRIKLLVSVMKPSPAVPNPNLWVEIGSRDVDYREITGGFDTPEELVYEYAVDDSRGVQVQLSSKVEIPYSIEGFENDDTSKPEDNLPGGIGMFRPRFDRKTVPMEKHPVPYVIVQNVEIDLDYVAAWPPAHWQVKMAPISDNADSANRLLKLWMERAYRRPVASAEQERFFALYQKLRSQQMSFDEALRATFQSVLMSGGFRYLPSPNDADPVVSQHAIASRLSFMLWGAPPDTTLRQLAAAGKLRDPAVLDAQVERLLADARSDAFFRPFIMQWLDMDQPITIAMDNLKKQDFRFGRHLKASLREETIRYIALLIAENRPAKEMIISDWTLMNDILAIHYGYPRIEGSKLQKVKLRPDDPRGGGILGHGGLQSMLTWMGENWVIYRGSWAMKHILNDPPPPPPLEVPELNPSSGGNKGKPFRELLKQHQADPNCSICHRKMDPLGFAFQNFDISGRWRAVEFESYSKNELDGKIAWVGNGKTRPVDTTGRLPRGEEFKTFAECRQLIGENYREDLVGGLMDHLLLYAAGRQPDVLDKAEIRKIIKAHANKGYPLKDILKAVVGSAWKADP